jgi:hypothetical protein
LSTSEPSGTWAFDGRPPEHERIARRWRFNRQHTRCRTDLADGPINKHIHTVLCMLQRRFERSILDFWLGRLLNQHGHISSVYHGINQDIDVTPVVDRALHPQHRSIAASLVVHHRHQTSISFRVAARHAMTTPSQPRADLLTISAATRPEQSAP